MNVLENVGKTIFLLSELSKKEHGPVICYPGTNLESFESRLSQLEKIRVTRLILEGESKVGRFGIIGRGCVSTVVKARLKNYKEPVALKIRRVDANRPDMKKDYDLQTFANSFGVGPKALSYSQDLFAMEYVDAVKLGKWFQKLRTRTSKKYTRALIRNAFEQCYRLDVNGLDHGELSNPTKHLLIRKSGSPEMVIIDYESASRERRVANLTSVASFFFLGGWQSEKIRRILDFYKFPRKRFIEVLKKYKSAPSEENLSQVLSLVRC
jgi:putative serine/threonine protein kinase